MLIQSVIRDVRRIHHGAAAVGLESVRTESHGGTWVADDQPKSECRSDEGVSLDIIVVHGSYRSI